MSSPSHFELDTEEVENQQRAQRLSDEWLKVEKALDQAGVLKTIVFFGSARIEDKRTAEIMQDKVDQLSLSNKRSDVVDLAHRNAKLTLAQSRYYEDAHLLAKLIGQYIYQTNDLHTKLITGGGPGIMEAANRGAADIGQSSIGLNITIPHEQKSNPYISEDLSFNFRYFSLRKMHFLKRAKVIVAFPGGFGTLDELLEVLTLIQTKKIAKIPIILYGQEYWKRIIDFDYLAQQQLIDNEDLELFTTVDDVLKAKQLVINCLSHCQ